MIIIPIAVFVLSVTAAPLDDRTSAMSELSAQFLSDVSTFMTKDQVDGFLNELVSEIRDNGTVTDIIRALLRYNRDAFTGDQIEDFLGRINKIIDAKGGSIDEAKKIMTSGFAGFDSFVNPILQEIREKAEEMEKVGKSSDEISAYILTEMKKYWNKEFGQKVVDAEKAVLSLEDWKIVVPQLDGLIIVSNYKW